MTICKYCSFHLNGSDDVGLSLLHGFCDIGHIALHLPVVLVTVGRIRIIRILDTIRLYLLLVPQDSLSVLYGILFVKQTFNLRRLCDTVVSGKATSISMMKLPILAMLL